MSTSELITQPEITNGRNNRGNDVISSSQSSRQVAEVRAMMEMAKLAPRDETAAINRIVNSCKRPRLAEASMYSYPRGGQQITGPSIRLAEAMAQAWGNLDFGIVELEQKNGESVVMSYCVDLETNTRQTKIFTVKHELKSKGGIKKLNDPRDIYEMTANQGARRLRACILGVIPGDVQDVALEQCEKTLAGNNEKPLIDRVRSMVAAFDGQGVTQKMLEDRLGHKIDVTNEAELVNLRKIYTSLKDGMSKREDWFEFETKQVKRSELNDTIKPKAKPAEETAALEKQLTDLDEQAVTDGSLFNKTKDAAQQ